MLGEYSKKMADLLTREDLIAEDDSDIYRYGIEILFQKIVHYGTMLFVGFCFGMLLETIAFMVFWGLLRVYAGGFHASKQIICYAISWSIIPIVLSLLKWIPWTSTVALFVGATALLVILKYAPVGNTNKPLDDMERKVYRSKTMKLLVLETGIALLCGWFGLHVVTNIVSLSFATEAIMLLLGRIHKREA